MPAGAWPDVHYRFAMSTDPRLDEQIDYYRAIAGEYESHAIDEPGKRHLLAAFADFDIRGDVLELACGTGQWTVQLLNKADSLTAIDASPEMIDRARSRIGDNSVRFVRADLFSWQPVRRYDSVFFGFWLSHVPLERFDGFWALIAASLKPDGQAFFVDDNHRTEAELIEGEHSTVVKRRLNDGTSFRVIKVPHQAGDLDRRLRALGWDVDVSASGPFYWGRARRKGKDNRLDTSYAS